jgi:hypothetical protein
VSLQHQTMEAGGIDPGLGVASGNLTGDDIGRGVCRGRRRVSADTLDADAGGGPERIAKLLPHARTGHPGRSNARAIRSG